MVDPAKSTITIGGSGKRFTSKEHGDLARLIMLRFGNDLESATAAWRRMLQNSATESDFAEILTWDEVPEYKPPVVPPNFWLSFRHRLRHISAYDIQDCLRELNPFGVVVNVKITAMGDHSLVGDVDVQSHEEGIVTRRFHVKCEHDFYVVRAFSKTRRFHF